MKGIIFAGGLGTRLYPFTKILIKSAFPIYDKPTIYFQIECLKGAGVRDVIIRTHNEAQLKTVLGGENADLGITYIHERPEQGNVEALMRITENGQAGPFLASLGDIWITPPGIKPPPSKDFCYVYASSNFDPARISEYGVIEADDEGRVHSFEEKPSKPKGSLVHMGVTFFPDDVGNKIRGMHDPEHANLVDLANEYLKEGRLFSLRHEQPWFNMGTFTDVLAAANFRRKSTESL